MMTSIGAMNAHIVPPSTDNQQLYGKQTNKEIPFDEVPVDVFKLQLCDCSALSTHIAIVCSQL